MIDPRRGGGEEGPPPLVVIGRPLLQLISREGSTSNPVQTSSKEIYGNAHVISGVFFQGRGYHKLSAGTGYVTVWKGNTY